MLSESDLITVRATFLAELKSPSDRTLLENIELVAEGRTVIVLSPNAFFQRNILSKFKDEINCRIRQVLGDAINIEYAVKQRERNSTRPAQPIQMVLPTYQATAKDSGLNPRFTFEEFVVGSSNAFAYQAALTVAEQAKRKYNPLYFCSDIGLGKSHIAHAIANRAICIRPETRAKYITATDFTNEYVSAVRNNTVDGFKRAYRGSQMDILFVDDVHLFNNKEKTQRELSCALDDLICAGTQVIFSGFRPPNSIPNMDKGLVSRIASGLVINIKRPDKQTRAAIVTAKARKEGYELASEVTDYIACQSFANIREIEGSVLNLVAVASIMRREITLELAQEVVGGASENKPRMDVPMIQEFVVKNYGLRREMLTSPSRKKEVMHPRQVAIYLCRRFTDETLEAIGQAFQRKHSSVIHALEVMDSQYRLDMNIRKEIDFLIDKLGVAG